MTYDDAAFAAEYGLEEHQQTACRTYAALLTEAQAHTNLIGPATLPDLWQRHFADSAQLRTLARGGSWLDIGSGAGFPGLVLAILGEQVTLVESRQKKAAFLGRVAARLGIEARATVVAQRLEALEPFRVDRITARAVAPIAQLFDWGLPFAAKSTLWIFPKGRSVAEEIATAADGFRFEHHLEPSRTSPEGRIFVAAKVERRRG